MMGAGSKCAGSKGAEGGGGGNSRGLVLLLLASCGLIMGLLFDYMPMIVDNQIKRQLELATNEEIQSFWSRPPVDINSYYWLYHLENAEQFMLHGEKVKVKRVGPFHFISRLEKRILEISQNKFRLFYNSTRHIRLNESLAEGIDEPLQLLNPIYVTMSEATRRMAGQLEPQQAQIIIGSAQRLVEKFNETLVMQLTARQALMGREVKLMGAAKKLQDTFGLGQQLPDALPGNIFGYVAIQNGTWSGPFEIYTGYQASMSSLGDIISYGGKRRLTEYQGRCNRLQTSAGELRPMPIGDNEVLEMFRPEMCRIIRLKPTAGIRKIKEGLAIGYTIAPEDFASVQENPDNRCFCQNVSTGDYCSLSGAIELAPCSYWAPIVVTVSNLKLDSKIVDTIQDWDPELFSSHLETVADADLNQVGQLQILKRIGMPLKVDLTVIIFMKVIRDERYRQLRNVPAVSYVPLIMSRDQAVIPPHLAQIIVNLERFLALARHLKVVMYLSAVVLLCWLTGHYYSMATRERVQPTSGVSNGADLMFSAGSNIDGRHLNGAGNGLVSPQSSIRSQAGDSVGPDQQSLGTSISIGIGQPIGSSQSRRKRSADNANQEAELEQPTRETNGEKKDEEGNNNSNTRQQYPPSVFFSKVDEMRGGGVRSTGNFEQLDARNLDLQTGEGAKEEEPTSSKEEPSEIKVSRVLGKNWFVKVYSNFVRMLDEIRSSISDAGQLDISENDYQDKQLEMLAGRIDTWQRQGELDVGAVCQQHQPQPLSAVEPPDSSSQQVAVKDPADGPNNVAAESTFVGPNDLAPATKQQATGGGQIQSMQRGESAEVSTSPASLATSGATSNSDGGPPVAAWKDSRKNKDSLSKENGTNGEEERIGKVEQPVFEARSAAKLMVNHSTSTDDSLLAPVRLAAANLGPNSLDSPIDERSSSASASAGNKLAPNGVLGDNDAHDRPLDSSELVGSSDDANGRGASDARGSFLAGATDQEAQDQNGGEKAELDSRKGINAGDKEPAILLSALSSSGATESEAPALGNAESPLQQPPKGQTATASSANASAKSTTAAPNSFAPKELARSNNISGAELAPTTAPSFSALDEPTLANKRLRQARQIKGATTLDTINGPTTTTTTTSTSTSTNSRTTTATQPANGAGGNHISHHGKIILQRQANGSGGGDGGDGGLANEKSFSIGPS